MYNDKSHPTLTNVTFAGNFATDSGGGMANLNNSSPTLVNVIFSGNSTTDVGGGIMNNQSNPTLTNVTFAGNSAYRGGGMSNSNSGRPVIRNTIFWTNTVVLSDAAILIESGSPVLTNTLIQGGCPAGATCNGVLLISDPWFVRNPDSGDGDWTTLADNDYGDLRLTLASPAINAGDNSFVTVGTDLDGNPRIFDILVDLGAYEFQKLVYRIFLPLLNH